MAAPRPAPAVTPYDPLAEVYDQLYLDPVSLAENALVFARLAPLLGPSRGRGQPFVLDLGCGTGLLLEQVALDPALYLGIDCSAPMLERAHQKFPAYDFHLAFMEDLPRDLPPVDVAVALFASFSYCENQPRAMRRIMQALRPGGCFAFLAAGRHYLRRQAHALERRHGLTRDPTCLSTLDVHALCGAVGCHRVFVAGLNAFADALPSWTPGAWVTAYLRLEWLTVGHLWPDWAHFLYVEAWKA